MPKASNPSSTPAPAFVPLRAQMQGQLPAAVLARLAADWAHGLAALHAEGRLHLALRPEVLWVSRDLSQGQLGDPVAGGEVPAHAYHAPEQSGRLAHPTDHRADLYALGVILFELATGKQPFAASGAAASLHLHLTHVPPPAHSLAPDLPKPLSDLIARLLAKDPEARPQSAAEVQTALSGDVIKPKLHLPEVVYGQDEVFAALLAQVAAGVSGTVPRIVRVTGPSGAGKSTLVVQLAKSLPPQTRLIQGKFDQLDRTRPYSAFLPAFDMALRQILAGDQQSVEVWRNRFLDALSPNAQVLLDIMPRYQALIGPQPPVPALGLKEAQIRFSLVFRRFLGALARADAPLVLFVDDVQWADAASIGLMRLMLMDAGLRDIVLLAVYRDSEVGADHPLQLMLQEVEGLPPALTVRPLKNDEVVALVATSLGTGLADVAPLAAIIARKTAGNPYFIRQFLLALVRSGRIFHDDQTGIWRWDADDAQAEVFTENVVDLVAERILALPIAVQNLLQIGACIGTQFETGLLVQFTGQPAESITIALSDALDSDALGVAERGPTGDVTRYQFLHDRVQQAANAMLDEGARSRIHARLGSLLLAQHEGDDAHLIQTTDHLIAGISDLDAGPLARLRDLSLSSAARSMASNAYQAAQRYFRAAAHTVAGDVWLADPDLAFLVDMECAKIAYLLGQIPEAEAMAAVLLTRNLSILDRVAVLELMILLHNSELRYLQAISVGAQALTLLDATMPMQPSALRFLASFALTKFVGRNLSDAKILALPRLTDPRRLAIMRVLVLLSPPAYFTSQTLLPLIAVRSTRMSMIHGNSPNTPFSLSIYGMLHAFVLGQPKRAVDLAELSTQLIPLLDAQSITARVLFNHAGFIKHWAAPLIDCLGIFSDAIKAALAAGEVETHGYCRYGHGSYALMAGLPLDRVIGYLEDHLAAVTAVRHEKTRRIMTMALCSLHRMRGQVFSQPFDEIESTALWAQGQDATSLAYYHKYKMLEALMQGDYPEVHRQALGMKANDHGTASMAYQPFYKFYLAIALLHTSGAKPVPTRALFRAKAAVLRRHLRGLARLVPQTHAHRAVLIEAEEEAVAGKTATAMALFDQGVAMARQSGALHDVAFGLERAGLFYLHHGARDQARDTLQKAMAAYREWGGDEWARLLARRHPDLALDPGQRAIGQPLPGTLDGDTLLQAAAVITETTSVAEIAVEILRCIVENAGATRGVLLLAQAGTLRLAAEVGPAGNGSGYPASLTNLAFRSGESIVLADARAQISTEAAFATDRYLASVLPQSVLCTPLIARGVVIGVVYLENPHLRGAFTPDRASLVEVLGAQAAISLENGRLLEQLQGALERQADLTSAHARFVPHSFLEMLGRSSILDVRLGDYVRGTSSILFADIRGFTPLIEAMPPDQVMDFVNGFLARMEPPVREGNGFIDSIVGDAVMAVFERGAEAGVIAGIAMLRALQDWQAREGLSVQIGIGVATGDLIFGTIGAAGRLQCGVLGDTVNLASRVETLTKHYGLGFLITDTTHDALPDPARFCLREVDRVAVAGRATPVSLYEVFDADPEPLRIQKTLGAADIAIGLSHYRSGDIALATAAFGRAATLAPDDPLTKRLAARCARTDRLQQDGNWTGIERMVEK
ncbi:AAA family ATPase [Tabrizicola sp.]|uniref:AAA family ATPase n=1 Tax=Tabrizicola sp. TaxID=2005166 RepID=UPI00286A12BF|nr:AAA family ATPase [Tabrizicola sp.]